MVVSDGAAITGVFMDAQKYRPAHGVAWVEEDDGLIRAARTQFAAYFRGELTEFDLPLAPAGTPFQLQVWEALRGIPYGETISYGELARRIGRPAASRAVGAANGHNPIGIVVPCHRVIGANGSLTGYGGGLDRKRTLLALEAETLVRGGMAAGGQRTLAFATS
ncbi:MAG: methylated-DNA--[protein]-cysteine S-methyltransferase [Dehalococcoidia bacterium]